MLTAPPEHTWLLTRALLGELCPSLPGCVLRCCREGWAPRHPAVGPASRRVCPHRPSRCLQDGAQQRSAPRTVASAVSWAPGARQARPHTSRSRTQNSPRGERLSLLKVSQGQLPPWCRSPSSHSPNLPLGHAEAVLSQGPPAAPARPAELCGCPYLPAPTISMSTSPFRKKLFLPVHLNTCRDSSHVGLSPSCSCPAHTKGPAPVGHGWKPQSP